MNAEGASEKIFFVAKNVFSSIIFTPRRHNKRKFSARIIIYSSFLSFSLSFTFFAPRLWAKYIMWCLQWKRGKFSRANKFAGTIRELFFLKNYHHNKATESVKIRSNMRFLGEIKCGKYISFFFLSFFSKSGKNLITVWVTSFMILKFECENSYDFLLKTETKKKRNKSPKNEFFHNLHIDFKKWVFALFSFWQFKMMTLSSKFVKKLLGSK